MHKTAVALAKVLGVLAIVLTSLWCLAGRGFTDPRSATSVAAT